MPTHAHPLPNRPPRAASRRRGYTMILVLLMIAMTMTVSYSVLRTQSSSTKMANNGSLQFRARQAAWTGMSAGMRRISQTTWGGVGSTVTGNLSNSCSYALTYTTGDTQLTTTDANAADWPYRVTITATGYAADTTGLSSVVTSYRMESVLRLVPKQLAATPSPWSTMMSYVYYQTNADNISVQLPLQINGPMRWQGSLQTFVTSYPLTTVTASRYLSDLNAMRSGYGDYRPFTGPITLPIGSTTVTNRNLLSSNLGISLSNATAVTTSNFSHPGSPTTYRLYPGGSAYSIPTLGATISNTTYQANPRTNPAGIFLRSGDLTIGSNTTIAGTVITTGNLILTGTNVSLQPADLPALTSTTAVPQLPAVIAASDVRVTAGSSSTVRGTVAAFSNFVSLAGTQTTTFSMQGNLISRSLDVQNRTEWNTSSFNWGIIWSLFSSQLSNSNPILHYPVYAQALMGFNYAPLLTISTQTGSVTRQWFAPDTPLYSVYTGDAGLVWSVVRITELH
jgi:Tfp pilus assembly protein PilX